MNQQKQNEEKEDQLQEHIDKKVHHKLQIEGVHERQGVWQIQQSVNGKLIISVLNASIIIRSQKQFDNQQRVKFITNEELLIWNSQYLMKLNVINQQIAFTRILNKKYPIYYLDFSVEKQLIFIGSTNIKIRSLINGLILLESQQQKNDEVEYIKYQKENQIITRHKLNVIIIWTLNIDQSIIEQCQVINPLDNLEFIYTSMVRQDYIFTIQWRNKLKERQFFIIVYKKTGSIINITRQMCECRFMIIKIVGQHLNTQLNENKCIYLQTHGILDLVLDTIYKFKLKV